MDSHARSGTIVRHMCPPFELHVGLHAMNVSIDILVGIEEDVAGMITTSARYKFRKVYRCAYTIRCCAVANHEKECQHAALLETFS